MDITIKTPNNFNFRRTVLSHGWCALPPFEFDKESWTLFRVLGSDKPVTAKISALNGAIKVVVSRRLGREAAQKLARDVRHMFRLDDDLSEFYQAVEAEPEFAWIANEGAGRLLRSPTVFEDLVKMICTTNCSWALTEKMVNGLVNELGVQSVDGRKSFPSAEAMAQESVKFFKDKIRAGYRAPYLKELAQRSERAFAFFNNNASSHDPENPLGRLSQAAANARQLRRLLDANRIPATGGGQ